MPVAAFVIKDGVKYDLADYGLALLKHNIPLTPPKEVYTVDVPGKAGLVRMGSKDKSREFTLEFILMAEDSTYDYQSKLADLSELLYSDEPLYWIFGDREGKRIQGEYNGYPDIDKVIFDGYLSIPIICHNPYFESVNDLTSGWSYGSGNTYGMGLRYGDVSSFSVKTNPTTFTVYNGGNIALQPRILMVGKFTNLRLSDGRGNELVLTRVNQTADTVEVDCEQGQIYLNSFTNIYSQGNGVFFVLPKGETIFTVTSSEEIDCQISFTPFQYKYTY
mgnify:CR=1 FL=1